MITYRCEKDNIELDTSVCPHCGERAYPVKSEIFWCHTCNVPSFSSTCKCCHQEIKKFSSDARPVFPEEKILLECIIRQQKEQGIAVKSDDCLEQKSVWNGTGNNYYVDGKNIGVKIGKLRQLDIERVRQEYNEAVATKLASYQKFFDENMQRFVKANELHFKMIEQEAIGYIREKGRQYEVGDMMISFSGGKDSTVVADLVTRALGDGKQKILHIFGDTTLEFPSTYEYVERYKKSHPKTPIISSRNKEKDFFELCKLIGPPSRVMRWCCTIFKTGAITRKIEKLFRNKKHIVTFYGIRRSESVSRSKYEKESNSPKITKQTVVSPVIDWYDFDIWLYLLTRGIDFNEAYRWGYARVGCWCCPNNSQWSEFLSKIHIEEQYNAFRQQLIEFASQIGKPDPEVYVDDGKWKARQGGNGLEMAQKSVISFEPCATEENSFNYELQRPISKELYELFKPFGWLDFNIGNARLGEVYVKDKTGNLLLKLQGRIGTKSLKVSIYNHRLAGARSLKVAEERIKCQITKYQMCMGCLACEGVCKFGAISIKEVEDGVRYEIADGKCMRCGECVAHFNVGCYMRKVLSIKR